MNHLADRIAEGSRASSISTLWRTPRSAAMRLAALAAMLAFVSILGSCAGFSDSVADHWPHWAGGMPADVPPRPGAPGYDEFIAHQRASNAATPDGQAAANAMAPPNAPAPAPLPPSVARPATGQNTGQGGLY
jgi:hypothetical protein